MIKKERTGYALYSKSGSKKLGESKTKKGIEKREKQVEYFKHKKKK